MANTLSNEFLDCIVSFLKLKLSDTLAQAIEDGHQQGKETRTILDETLGGMIIQAVRSAPPSPPSSQVQNGMVVATATAAPKKAPAAGVLTDTAGNALKCSCIVQTTKEPCKNNGKYTEADGNITCGLHHRSYASKKADPTKRPGAMTPKVGTSSFTGIVGISDSASFSSFKPDDLASLDSLPSIIQ